ncbi:RNA 2'-phosphotransferase [Adhaeribacter arboris]|uniref:Probable RNA 2'-phosphotransferase n=1 Tax=Adhaeribacter arboris TaxID=2072846 RepID=A0A2T2YP84_9BACT|nr:RNA 2'-phosphotransferase [Adhaeribacter arboris]
MPEKEITRISKFLSLVLRHQPEKINITLDENGWTDVATLIQQVNKSGSRLSFEILDFVVANNNKKRFAFNPDKTKIRAHQGHSVEIKLGYPPQTPPAVLYHGTSEKNLASILAEGIQKRNRHQVHLSPDKSTALTVGQRHGKPVILQVDAAAMHAAGLVFYLSENQVWLTGLVHAEFLHVLTT